MNELTPLEHRLSALIANLSAPQRKQLNQALAQKLSESQRKRIKQQQNPDGSAYAPRKVQQSKQKRQGKIRRNAMFRKLGTARFLKRKATDRSAELGYQGGNATIARVHQFGLTSRVQKDKDYKVQYEQRELLGLSESDLQLVEDLVVEWLAKPMTG
ncbi:phage tail protein [Pasteurellaceae bacterium Macca]|nr:phage tail protein [Pasteurellaceae bacterium Macca]